MEMEETDDRSSHSPRSHERMEGAPKRKQNEKLNIKRLQVASYRVLDVKNYKSRCCLLIESISYDYKAAIMVPSHGRRKGFVRFYMIFCKPTFTCQSYYFVVRSTYLSNKNSKKFGFRLNKF